MGRPPGLSPPLPPLPPVPPAPLPAAANATPPYMLELALVLLPSLVLAPLDACALVALPMLPEDGSPRVDRVGEGGGSADAITGELYGVRGGGAQSGGAELPGLPERTRAGARTRRHTHALLPTPHTHSTHTYHHHISITSTSHHLPTRPALPPVLPSSPPLPPRKCLTLDNKPLRRGGNPAPPLPLTTPPPPPLLPLPCSVLPPSSPGEAAAAAEWEEWRGNAGGGDCRRV